MEALVEGDLVKLLSQRGIEVDHTACNVKSRNGALRWEIDILAANGEEVVAVEVKTTLKVRQVADFIETLKGFPEEAPSAYRRRRTYGAVAYLKADEKADVYAERQGLYVIRAAGSSASITNREDFKPRDVRRLAHAARTGDSATRPLAVSCPGLLEANVIEEIAAAERRMGSKQSI